MYRVRLLTGLAALGLGVAVGPAAGEGAGGGWGTVTGQVVWAGGEAPQRAPIKVDRDEKACLKNGPLLEEKYVVDPTTKGVRWVMVWLQDPANPKKALPTHPSLKAPAKKAEVMDQPCCQFEPHVLGLREGQDLVGKNSAAVPH